MTTPPCRIVDISGEEALYLLDGAAQGRLVFQQRRATAVRPASHAWELGRLTIRAPVATASLSGGVAVVYHTDQIDAGSGAGWTVTASGLAEVVSDPDEAAHYRRALPGWVHGPHDTVLRVHPQAVTGYRFGEAGSVPGAGPLSERRAR